MQFLFQAINSSHAAFVEECENEAVGELLGKFCCVRKLITIKLVGQCHCLLAAFFTSQGTGRSSASQVRKSRIQAAHWGRRMGRWHSNTHLYWNWWMNLYPLDTNLDFKSERVSLKNFQFFDCRVWEFRVRVFGLVGRGYFWLVCRGFFTILTYFLSS